MSLAAAVRRRPAAPLLGAAGPLAAALLLAAALGGRGPERSVMPDLVEVPLDRPIWVQRHEVTVAEWNLCAADGGCARALRWRPGQDPSETPATRIDQPEAAAYAAWVSRRAGHPVRLPTIAEWTALAAGVVELAAEPLFSQPELDWASAYLVSEGSPRALRSTGSFSVSPHGVADLDGPVWEWTSACHAAGAGAAGDRCPAFWVGGEHLAAVPFLERDPARGGCAAGRPPAHLGLRLVTDRAPPNRAQGRIGRN